MHTVVTNWVVEIGDELVSEWSSLDDAVQTEILAHARLLQRFGPGLGRPRVDTLKGSRCPNMKELRFRAADGERRVAFAFDPRRRAILLAAGDKAGAGQRRFYRDLIARADHRFAAHLARLQGRT